MENLILTRYEDIFQADLALAFLKEDGVEASITKDKEEYDTKKRGFFNILVPLYDIEKAIIALDRLENE